MLRETQVSVLLMDMKFPDMDGFHLVRTIVRQPVMRRPVIIAVTACTMPGDKQMCYGSGCDGYVPKPVSLPILINTMDRLFKSDDRQRRIA
jgi:CheY-like chemotaxis protein